MSKHYYPGPDWVDIDRHQESPIGSSRLPLPEGIVDRHDVFENRHRPPTKHGFIIRNGAKIKHYASFHFDYDDHTEKEIDIHLGDKVAITFNKPSKHDHIPNVITAEGIIKEINMVDNGFTLTVDCSEEYKSQAYIIGSNAVLDVSIIDDKEKPEPPAEEPKDDAPTVDDVIEVVPSAPHNHHCEHHHHHHHHDHTCLFPDPSQPVHNCRPSYIDWNNSQLSMIKDESRGYSVLNVVYAKKSNVDVLMVIYDIEGNVIYKALDNSKKVSMQSHFVWSLRDYISYINDHVSIVDRLDRYTLDSSGKFVMTKGSVLDTVVKEVDDSNECFPEATQFIIELVAGKDLLDYHPGSCTHDARDVISKRFSITADMLKLALNPVTEEEVPGTDVDPEKPSTGEGNTDNPGGVKPDPEAPSGTEEGKDPSSGEQTSGTTGEGTDTPVEKPETPSTGGDETNTDTPNEGGTEDATPDPVPPTSTEEGKDTQEPTGGDQTSGNPTEGGSDNADNPGEVNPDPDAPTDGKDTQEPTGENQTSGNPSEGDTGNIENTEVPPVDENGTTTDDASNTDSDQGVTP